MHITVDPTAFAPIYEQIRAGVADAIDRGEIEAGQPLPSIRALARDLRVSVITTTRAYTELVADGYADAVQGKGVYVRERPAQQVRERALARIEASLAGIVTAAATAGIAPEELHRMLDSAIEEDR
ncbi:GntR family transcriptional regulator [Brachybacterium sp. AOP25-B2-12]|uniref:GntR family transcriptional regulator n=1 Tax=Brachybacterium sp. AOP25-B2-12 TaxID=3457710 RepID=UPI0040336A81